MGNKLYVGNLSYDTTQGGLQDLFAQAGEVVSVDIITDRETGVNRGFGFVEMATADSAQAAIRQFDGYTLDNRTLKVNEAKPRSDNGGSARRRY